MLPISSTRVEVKSTCAVALVLFGSTSLRKQGVAEGVAEGATEAEAEGVAVGVGGGVAVAVALGVGVTPGVGDAQAPAIRVTSSMTKLPVPVVGPMYSTRHASEAPLANAFRLIVF